MTFGNILLCKCLATNESNLTNYSGTIESHRFSSFHYGEQQFCERKQNIIQLLNQSIIKLFVHCTFQQIIHK